MIQKFKIKNQLLDVSGLFQCEVCGVDTGVLSVQPQQKIGGHLKDSGNGDHIVCAELVDFAA